MPPLQYLDRDKYDGWASLSSASSDVSEDDLDDQDETTTHTEPESRLTTVTTVKFESLSPSASPCPGSSSNLLYDIPATRPEEWSDATTEDEEENKLLQEFMRAPTSVDHDYKPHTHANSGQRRSSRQHSAVSGDVDDSRATLPYPTARTEESSSNPDGQTQDVPAKRKFRDHARIPRNPYTKDGERRILAGDAAAIWRVFRRLEASKEWKKLSQAEREALREREKEKLMRERFENRQSWEFWSSDLAPAPRQPKKRVAVERIEPSRPVQSGRNKEPAQRADSAERAILKTLTSPTIDDDKSQLVESDSEEEDGKMDVNGPPRKTYGPPPYTNRKRQNISRSDLRNYIFLAACVRHARNSLKPDWSALSEELGISPRGGESKLRRLKKRLVEEGPEFGHRW
ncbi:hypothetical protein LTR10_020577 [Elasticomyces elasticus]|uniref:HMG box domain-containing protein n=1 Tax=Exophiala sideris TaxID=1016849 RepID=A0ABR0JK47_9EURO|nr:hypothetical protein LTR10_020577 [Elasticomyces elasticus]KAK5035430.1 hypothetical protein LTS07_002868 [Exophiala sideris]KAK5039218.1 hypothetical protein LTR13_003474 [Exophiala sideris]KAK5066355.1 hypothetical protein LTR69_002874 [Exophiala sideris]KAK5187032.1 hypothetical protein LTR44_001039 [Eurotiomycetes sp. CCFEE 6388]